MATAVKNDTFEQEVIQSDIPVLVDFWAEWCGPCHAVAPVLDRIVEEQAGALKLVKVNIDEERELAERFGIASIPTMILFRDGEPSVSVIGAQPKGAIERTLGLTRLAPLLLSLSSRRAADQLPSSGRARFDGAANAVGDREGGPPPSPPVPSDVHARDDRHARPARCVWAVGFRPRPRVSALRYPA